MIITASVPESGFRSLKGGTSQTIETSFALTAHYKHMVGDGSGRGSQIVLATSTERVFRPIGGVFAPCDYLAVGPIISASDAKKIGNGPERQDLVIDVGMALRIGRPVGAFSGRPSDKSLIEPGEWLAAIGSLFCWPGSSLPTGGPVTECRPVEGFVVDLNPGAPTFGSLIPWPLGSCPPHDPDVVGYPVCFVRFSVDTLP